ncbi:RNA-binding protein CP29B, chloroplastic [Physcomitrium patens]|uniref:RRM domain-containing protein n=1 Tax=Physcomitrium patens TaxID=3218 RepID=A0A2K1K7L6_PHYPA|nr:RNA-binding protein CP29B, chloroplastic-like [Physcomitrium patens]PNR49765.1 hypothetical protein PHYPA_011661 [Physcomitrium patens]|eukprot:XP_024382952.1 RNA-binding protein CP29B, chloroplastic-like [Physcomitrella patens]
MSVASMTMAVSTPRFVAAVARAETNSSRHGSFLSMAAPVSGSSLSCAFSAFSLVTKRSGLIGGIVARASDLDKELDKQLYGSVTDDIMGGAVDNDSGFSNDGIAVSGVDSVADGGSSDVAAPVAEEEQFETKLYVGNLPWTCDSAQLAEICSDHGTVDVVEVIYDKISGRSRGFAFVTMATPEDAQAVINALDGTDMGGRPLKVNYPQSQKDKPRVERSERPRDDANKLFVGNLSWGCDEAALYSFFSEYGTVVDAKVVFDRDSGRSRGFGFVTMESAAAANAAIENLDGAELDGRRLRVNLAGEKPPTREYEPSSPRSDRSGSRDRRQRDGPNKLFVGNLSWRCDEEALETLFSDYGRVLEARIATERDSGRSRGFGFVTLSSETEVNAAIESLDGADYDGRELRVNLAGDKPPPRY